MFEDNKGKEIEQKSVMKIKMNERGCHILIGWTSYSRRYKILLGNLTVWKARS